MEERARIDYCRNRDVLRIDFMMCALIHTIAARSFSILASAGLKLTDKYSAHSIHFDNQYRKIMMIYNRAHKPIASDTLVKPNV